MRCWQRKIVFEWAVVALVGALGAGCVAVHDDGPRGDLTLVYDFQGLGCGEAGVDSVDFALEGDRGDTASASTTCAPPHFTFVDLLEDGYRVVIAGFDSGNRLLYSGTFRATVLGNAEREVSVSLEPAMGVLTFYWTFQGRVACRDVVDVHVLLRDPFGTLYDDAFYPCTQTGVTYDRVIAGSWRVWLAGLDYADFVLYRADNVQLDADAGVDNVYDIDLR